MQNYASIDVKHQEANGKIYNSDPIFDFMRIEKMDEIDKTIPSIRDYDNLVTYSSPEHIVFGMAIGYRKFMTSEDVRPGTLGMQRLDYAVHGSREDFNQRIASIATRTILEERLRFNLTGREESDNLLAHLLVRFFNEESRPDLTNGTFFEKPGSLKLFIESREDFRRAIHFENITKTYSGGILNQYKLMVQRMESTHGLSATR